MSQYGSPPDPPEEPTPAGGSPGQDPYGAPPPANPYGEPNPYGGVPPTPPYGSAPPNPYGAAPSYGYGQAVGAPPQGYAPWIKRVGAYLLDGFLGAVAAFPLWIGYVVLLTHLHTTTDANGTTTTTLNGGGFGIILILVGIVTSLAFFVWNVCIRQGRTGYTIGKGALGIRLVGAESGEPIGPFMTFIRYVTHILDALPCYLGYLWPLWDPRCQTFSDKIMRTFVINQPQPR